MGSYSGKSTPTEKEGGIILKKPQIENNEDYEDDKSIKSSKGGKGGNNIEALYNLFLNHLLKPKEWASNENNIADNEMDRFHFRNNFILALVDECQKVIEEQPMVLKVESPVKVFGDIHGQYQDLMRFFDLWGEPSEKGDIESYDYLFLGDYVDRGSHSLETICLLMSLKIKYPTKIHLLRGNHEDKWINNAFGFAEECNTRLNEDPGEPESIFNRVNELFDWLPLAAIIEDKIVCLHGGIGSTLASLEQIEAIQRPLEVIHEVSTPEQQLVVDILWSDPTDNDQELGIQPNFIRDPNGTGNIVKFGPDRVKQFLENNGMSIILRAHECVMDGFERFAGGQLITVFSATDYCGRHKNAGAVLDITKQSEIIPKLIYPLNNAEHNWEERALEKRPPTPPRWSSGNRKESHE
jgi:protein phosphatase